MVQDLGRVALVVASVGRRGGHPNRTIESRKMRSVADMLERLRPGTAGCRPDEFVVSGRAHVPVGATRPSTNSYSGK